MQEDDLPLNKRVKPGSALKKPKAKSASASKPKAQKEGSKRKKDRSDEGGRQKKPRTAKEDGKSEKKWEHLHHNGVMFPPDYQPHGVKMLYDGREVDLTPEQEEVSCSLQLLSLSKTSQIIMLYRPYL